MWPLSDRRLVFTTRKEEVKEEWLKRLYIATGQMEKEEEQSSAREASEMKDEKDPFEEEQSTDNNKGEGFIIPC
jgi:hypothetical protein